MKTFTLGRNKDHVLELIPEKVIKEVLLGSIKVCVTRLENSFFAFETRCPHRKAELKQGLITNFGEIVCPLHQYRFDMKSGEVKSGSCGELITYQAELTEDGLKIFI